MVVDPGTAGGVRLREHGRRSRHCWWQARLENHVQLGSPVVSLLALLLIGKEHVKKDRRMELLASEEVIGKR